MDTNEALKLVLELAEGNMLSDRETRDAPELFHEQERQATAIATAKTYFARWTLDDVKGNLVEVEIGGKVNDELSKSLNDALVASDMLAALEWIRERAAAVDSEIVERAEAAIAKAEAAGIGTPTEDNVIPGVELTREYSVQMRRTFFGYATVFVRAASADEAIVLAKDEAESHRFEIDETSEGGIEWAHAEAQTGDPDHADWEQEGNL
jgi:hypothetical protein